MLYRYDSAWTSDVKPRPIDHPHEIKGRSSGAYPAVPIGTRQATASLPWLRFKGMERQVVVLVELPTAGERLDELLYVGLTRATTELVVIAPPELARRLG
jgi:UvrD-like helicase C-terminal domain